ncbi:MULTISPECIES: hypothetical protein [Cysteiniphilum]|uniref:Uncharacterized protein n=1 Tax=Cysteiniphilum litorale TaxID=2056700 RepID=A0A8J2Z5Z6_9GAMM|nr:MULTISPECIES: hypothetical protein [Cysteiniphilum]GGG04531.1 hypothetical protein GCM10010995_22530 [Cysteiniphilum litorale]
MGLISGAVQLATLASNAGKVIDGYNEVQKRLSASEDIETQLAVADYDTVVIVAKPAQAQAYRDFFNDKKLALKNMVSSGYNERAFDVAVKMGAQVSKEQFDKVQEKTSFWQKTKIRFADWFQGKNAYITDCLNPRMLKNVLTFNYENLESDNLKLIAKVLESLYHEYVSYYEWLAMNEDAKKVTQEDDEKLYAGCYYSEQKKLWIIHDENLWKTAVIVTHLVKILTCPNVQCHNDKTLVSGSFGIASIVPITLYHMHFLNEFLQKEYRRPEHDQEIKDKREKLASDAKAVVEKLSQTTSKGTLVKKMADYASNRETSAITDTEVANLLNIKALQLISDSLKKSQETPGRGVLGSFKESEAVVDFQTRFDEVSKDLVEAQKAHAESVKAIHDLQKSAQQCDVFVDSASLGNLFGILKNKRQTVISSYFKLHDFQGHLRVFQDYIVAIESFAQKSLPGDQVSLMLADKSLEYVVKNLPFQLSTIIFPSYPVIDNGIFITTCKEKYFQQMTSSSFEFLMVEEDKLTTADVDKLDQVTDALKLVTIEYVAQKDTLTLTHNQTAKIPQVKELVINYQLEQKEKIKGKKTLNELLGCFAKESKDPFAQFVQARHEALEGLKGFLKEIEAAFLTKEKVISVDASQNYREACYGQMTAFINEFVFGINQSHIKQVSELTMQMFSASYPEQMPFLQHMFRTRMGLLNEFAKFSSYDMVVHWQLAHSMLYFSTQELYGKGAIERGEIAQEDLKAKLFDYFQGKTPNVGEADLFLDQKTALIEQIASLRASETDFRFLISLCVAALMVEYDHLVQLYLVQQALRQLVGLYGEEFIRTKSFQEIIDNFTKVLSEVYKKFEDSSRALTKSIDAWKESLQKDATRVKVHGNSYQAVRKIAKLRERLDVYKELVTKTNEQVKAIEGAQEWEKAQGYTGFCQAFVDDSKAQIYAPQLEENLDTFYDANVIKAASTLKDKRYKDFQDSMHAYLEQGAKILKDLRFDNQQPKLVSMVVEDQLTEIALGQKLGSKPYNFTAMVQAIGAAQDIPSQIMSGFNSESKAYIYMQLVLSSSSSTLKNNMNIRQLVSFVINTEDMVNLYGLFSQLNELMLKMYAHGIGDEPIYQGDSKDKVLSERMMATLGEGTAQSRYAQLCNTESNVSLSEFIAKYLDLISVSEFKNQEKERLLNDDSVSFYTVAAEIMHALLQAYVKVAINIEYATRSRNFSGSEQNQLRLWAVDVMTKLQIKRFDESGDVRYQGFSPVYKVDDLKVSLLLKAMLSNTSERQKEAVGSLSTQRTTIQLAVQEQLKNTQAQFLAHIYNLTGSSAGRKDLQYNALITRKTTRSGQRKTPVYMNILTSMESNTSLRALSNYTFKSSHHVLDKQTFTQDSIVEIEKYRLLKGVMIDPKSQREIAFQSFGGFDQDVMDYLSTSEAESNKEAYSDKKSTWLAVRGVFDGGKKQALLAQAYLILDEPAKLQSLIDAYQTSGQFDLVLLDGSAVTSVTDANKKDPNSHEFYPKRQFKQPVVM